MQNSVSLETEEDPSHNGSRPRRRKVFSGTPPAVPDNDPDGRVEVLPRLVERHPEACRQASLRSASHHNKRSSPNSSMIRNSSSTELVPSNIKRLRKFGVDVNLGTCVSRSSSPCSIAVILDDREMSSSEHTDALAGRKIPRGGKSIQSSLAELAMVLYRRNDGNSIHDLAPLVNHLNAQLFLGSLLPPTTPVKDPDGTPLEVYLSHYQSQVYTSLARDLFIDYWDMQRQSDAFTASLEVICTHLCNGTAISSSSQELLIRLLCHLFIGLVIADRNRVQLYTLGTQGSSSDDGLAHILITQSHTIHFNLLKVMFRAMFGPRTMELARRLRDPVTSDYRSLDGRYCCAFDIMSLSARMLLPTLLSADETGPTGVLWTLNLDHVRSQAIMWTILDELETITTKKPSSTKSITNQHHLYRLYEACFERWTRQTSILDHNDDDEDPSVLDPTNRGGWLQWWMVAEESFFHPFLSSLTSTMKHSIVPYYLRSIERLMLLANQDRSLIDAVHDLCKDVEDIIELIHFIIRFLVLPLVKYSKKLTTLLLFHELRWDLLLIHLLSKLPLREPFSQNKDYARLFNLGSQLHNIICAVFSQACCWGSDMRTALMAVTTTNDTSLVISTNDASSYRSHYESDRLLADKPFLGTLLDDITWVLRSLEYQDRQLMQLVTHAKDDPASEDTFGTSTTMLMSSMSSSLTTLLATMASDSVPAVIGYLCRAGQATASEVHHKLDEMYRRHRLYFNFKEAVRELGSTPTNEQVVCRIADGPANNDEVAFLQFTFAYLKKCISSPLIDELSRTDDPIAHEILIDTTERIQLNTLEKVEDDPVGECESLVTEISSPPPSPSIQRGRRRRKTFG